MIRDKLKKIKILKYVYDMFRMTSIRIAVWQQGLDPHRLEKIVPNIRDQYTSISLDSDYMKLKVRCQQAFQISLAEKYCEHQFSVIDIGDSSGNHIQYLKSFYSNLSALSVNVDRLAIKKIRRKGLLGIVSDAEEFVKSFRCNCDLLLMFQTLEHLENPISFLKTLKNKGNIGKFVITVPYLKKSRVGLYHIRSKYYDNVQSKTTEDIHIFELSPEDWRLLFKYTGWEIVKEKIYYQYPKYIPVISWLLKLYWRNFDFEGFYGVVLKKIE